MAFDSVAAVAEFYAATFARHRTGHRAVGWNTRHTQIVHFLQLIRVDGLAGGARVLDVGCGLGDLRGFLADRGIDVDYVGIDVCAPLVAEAQGRYPGTRFEVRDLLREPLGESFDFVFASGALSMRLPDHDPWVDDMLHAMFARCRKALVFNLLSDAYARAHPSYVDRDTYYYADAADVLARCLALSPRVTVDHAELAHSFTVYVYRANRAPVDRLIEHLRPGSDVASHLPVLDHFASLGMLPEAIAHLETLPETTATLDAIASLAAALGDGDREIAAWRRACELAPQSAMLYTRLAAALIADNRHAEALDALERARELSPHAPEIDRWIAQCRDVLGR